MEKTVNQMAPTYSHHNFLTLSTVIKKKLYDQKDEPLSDELFAEYLAYEISAMVPPDIQLDPHISINDILQWADADPKLKAHLKPEKSFQIRSFRPRIILSIIVGSIVVVAISLFFLP